MRLLRDHGEFQTLVDTSGSLLVAARPGAARAEAKRRLDELADAHDRIRHARVPKPLRRGEHEGRPFVSFACSATNDLGSVLERALGQGRSIDYTEGIVFIETMLEVLEAAHAAGTRFGALTMRNLFVDAAGECHVVGAGDNVLALDERGHPLQRSDVVFAPDVAAGAAISPGADLYAFTLLVRALIPYVVFPPRAERVLTGRVEPGDYELFHLFAWSNFAILASHPEKRPSVSEALEKERRAWELLGVRPNHAAFRELLLRDTKTSGPELLLDDEATYVAVAGTEPKPLGTRKALRRILSALVERHGSRPAEPLSVSELAEAGWPGELLLADAAKNRVYVALSSLRKLGLELLLERHDGGWRITPHATVRVSSSQDP